MKKILFGVVAAVAVAMLAGCNLGLGNKGGDLDGNKWDSTYTVDGTEITDGYMRAYEQFGSPNANLEKVQAITTHITVNKDGTTLSGSGGKAVWGFIFDLDKNKSNNYQDFCLVGIRQNESNLEYYMERYVDVNPAELKTGMMNRNALGAYFTMTGSELNTLYEADLLPGGTPSTNIEDTNGTSGNATCGFLGTKSIKGSADWMNLSPSAYSTSDAAYFDAYLHVTQNTQGKYVVYLTKSENVNTTSDKLGEFGIKEGTSLDKNSSKNQQETTIHGYERYGPVLQGNKGEAQTVDTKNKYYLAGGIAAYASCPKGTKLSVHYQNLKETLRGELFASPVE